MVEIPAIALALLIFEFFAGGFLIGYLYRGPGK